MWAAKWYFDVTSAVVLILVSLRRKKTTTTYTVKFIGKKRNAAQKI